MNDLFHTCFLLFCCLELQRLFDLCVALQRSAGELGSIYSYLYQGTGNIGECLGFGRIAGRNVAALPQWSD